MSESSNKGQRILQKCHYTVTVTDNADNGPQGAVDWKPPVTFA